MVFFSFNFPPSEAIIHSNFLFVNRIDKEKKQFVERVFFFLFQMRQPNFKISQFQWILHPLMPQCNLIKEKQKKII